MEGLLKNYVHFAIPSLTGQREIPNHLHISKSSHFQIFTFPNHLHISTSPHLHISKSPHLHISKSPTTPSAGGINVIHYHQFPILSLFLLLPEELLWFGDHAESLQQYNWRYPNLCRQNLPGSLLYRRSLFLLTR